MGESTPLKFGPQYRACGVLVRRRELAVALALAVIFAAIAAKEGANNALPVLLPSVRRPPLGQLQAPDHELGTCRRRGERDGK